MTDIPVKWFAEDFAGGYTFPAKAIVSIEDDDIVTLRTEGTPDRAVTFSRASLVAALSRDQKHAGF